MIRRVRMSEFECSSDNKCIPLSQTQKRFWFLTELEMPAVVYVNPKIINICGNLDVEVLEKAWAAVIARHSIFKVQLKEVDGEIYQELNAQFQNRIELKDFSRYEGAVWEKSREAISDYYNRPFHLTKAPLFRVLLIKIDAHEYVLGFFFHQIIADKKTVDLVIRELGVMYNSFKNGFTQLDTSNAYDYFDYLKHKPIKCKDSSDAGPQFWNQQFSCFPEALNLPYDHKRDRVANQFAACKIQFKSHRIDKLIEIYKSNQNEALILFITALYVLLKKYTGQPDICINTPFSGRLEEKSDSVPGPFNMQLPVRITKNGDMVFSDLLDYVRQVVTQSFHHADSVNISKILMHQGSRSLLPLFQVSLSLEKKNINILEIDACECREYGEYFPSEGYEIGFMLQEDDGLFTGQIQYNSTLFSANTISRMAGHYSAILDQVLDRPQISTAAINILSEEEITSIERWNKNEVQYQNQESIPSLFYKQVDSTPDATAIIQKDIRISYRELALRVEALQDLLLENGVCANDRVIVCMERSVESIVSILAILKTGALYVPLDPKYPQDRQLFIINDCNASVIISQSKFKEILSKSGKKLLIIDGGKPVKPVSTRKPLPNVTEDTQIYVIYTSGSTGVPKGIIGKNKGLVNRLFWVWDTYPYSRDEVCCHKISISFIDHLAEIFSPLLKGIPVVIFNSEVVTGINDFCNLLIDHKISRLVMTPSSLKLFLNEKHEKGILFKNIRFVFCSGEALPLTLAEKFYTEFSTARMINIYGASEVSADVTYYEVNRFSVKDVLHHFNHFSLSQKELKKYKKQLGHFNEYITKPDADLYDVSNMFTNYRLYETPQEIDDYYKMLYSDVLPFIINTASPKFIGHMTSALPDYLHDLSKLISQLNQNMVKIETSKSLTFLEREALAVLHRCFYKFTDEFYEENIQKVNANLGLITTGGTTSNIGALLSARNKILFGNTGNDSDLHESIYSIMHKKGYKDMVIIGSSLMHYSMKKASSILGLGINNIIYVKMRDDNRMDTDDLELQIRRCKDDNVLVLAVVGIAGATETGIIDPLEKIANITQKYGVHFHVDAAWGGALVFSDKYRYLLNGIEAADTITLCGHKQLFLPQGISICLFKDPDQINYAATTARYQASPNTYDFGRFTIEGSRSALSLCLHASLRILSKKGYEVLIDDGIEKARFFAEIISASSAFELIEKPQLNIVNYRYIPVCYRAKYRSGILTPQEKEQINNANELIQKKQFVRGNTFVSKTVLARVVNGKSENVTVFRAVLSNPLTTFDDLFSVLEDQLNIAHDFLSDNNDYGKGIANRKVNIVHDNISNDEKFTIPIGKPIYNTKVYIVDSSGNIAPIGVSGEICVSGDSVAFGYLNNEELNGSRFITNPFGKDPSERLYRTGDLGKYLPDGTITFLGRIDDQIKIRGIRIECGEIESILCSHRQIRDAAVIGKNSHRGMELVAYIVPEKENEIYIQDLKEFLKSKIPEYMVPSTFIEKSMLPVLPNGKVDKKKLRTAEVPQKEITCIEPRNSVEKELMHIWKELLNIEDVGMDDNFFHCGGSSITAIKLLLRIRNQFKVNYSFKSLLSEPTIAEIAEKIILSIPK